MSGPGAINITIVADHAPISTIREQVAAIVRSMTVPAHMLGQRRFRA